MNQLAKTGFGLLWAIIEFNDTILFSMEGVESFASESQTRRAILRQSVEDYELDFVGKRA